MRLLLIHGLLSTQREFGMITHSLRRKGVDHEALRIAGYTEAAGGPQVAWRDWVDAACDAVNRAAPGGEPVVLGGLCVGGMLAAAIALQQRSRVAGLAMLSPSFSLDGWGLSPWRHLRGLGYFLRLGRHITVAERDPFGIKNPRLRALIARDMRERSGSAAGPSRLPLWGLEQAEKLTRHVRMRLSGFERRLLVMHAREDEVSSLAGVRRVLDTLGLPADPLVVLEDSYHMITMDNDRHRVVEELARLVAPADSPRTRESAVPRGIGALAAAGAAL